MKLLRLLSVFLLQINFVCSAEWFVYVVDRFTGSATPIDVATNTPGSAISTKGAFPADVAITPDGKTAYVINAGMPFMFGPGIPGSARVIDIATSVMTTTISLAPVFFPAGIAITPDGKTVYVSGSDVLEEGYVIPISTDTNTLGTPIGLGPNRLGSIAITPDGRTAFVLTSIAGNVIPITLATQSVGVPIDFGRLDFLQSIAITPDGSLAYITTSNTQLNQLDIASLSPGTPIQLPYVGDSIAITPDGTKAYVTCPNGLNNRIVLPVDLQTQTADAGIDIPDKPFAIAITPDGRAAYVTTSGNVIIPIALDTQRVGSAIHLAGTSLAITPDQAPVAFFTVEVASAHSPTIFDASASTTATGTIVSYSWDFGDGNRETTGTPIVSHVYTADGQYHVTLTVTNSAGTSTTQTFTGETVSNNGGPSARFSQMIRISILPPNHLQGKQIKTRLLIQTDLVNLIKWNPPASGAVPISYEVYRNNLNTLIGTVPANKILKFEDRNRQKNVAYTYYVVSIDSTGASSLPASITIAPKY